MKYSDGLFLKVAREVAMNMRGKVDFNDNIIDATHEYCYGSFPIRGNCISEFMVISQAIFVRA